MKRLPPGRTLWAVLMIGMLFTTTIIPQSLKSARASAVAAFSTFHGGTQSLEWNPAGLISIKDWELSASSFHVLYNTSPSYSLHNATVGKRFLHDHAAAVQLSPGSIMEFVVPTTFVLNDSTTPVVSSYDKTISYSERYALGYAFRINENISLGFAARYLEEKVADTKYSLDANSVFRSQVVEYSGNAWNVNSGVLWSFNPSWIVGIGVNNLFHVTETQLPDEAQEYKMESPKTLYLGGLFEGARAIKFSFEADTKKQLRVGGEYSIMDKLQFRGGVYLTAEGKLKSEAIGIGCGASYQFIHADLSYLTYLNQENRRGVVDLSLYEQSGIENIEYNPYTSDRLTFTVSVGLGRTRESYTRIEYVELLNDVFPSSSAVHAFRPIGKARVRNVSASPVQAKIGFYVNHLMDSPTETKPYAIAPNDVMEIPFYAVFNSEVRSVSSLSILDADVYVSASTIDEYDDSYQTRLLVHGKNDWNGDATMLKYFITPADPAVVKLTRSILSRAESYLDTVASPLQLMEKAKLMCNEFISRLVYVNDPKSSQDYVQYPSETLSLRGGDCDDISVSYATLLMSVGISTAFIDVVPPDDPGNSHIFVMFNTGLSPELSNLISDNPKRFVIRNDEHGNESVWIPVETTAIRKGFEEAWRIGAEEYFQDVELHSGLVKGWVRIVDIQPVQ